jgi:hypothetical protein
MLRGEALERPGCRDVLGDDVASPEGVPDPREREHAVPGVVLQAEEELENSTAHRIANVRLRYRIEDLRGRRPRHRRVPAPCDRNQDGQVGVRARRRLDLAPLELGPEPVAVLKLHLGRMAPRTDLRFGDDRQLDRTRP